MGVAMLYRLNSRLRTLALEILGYGWVSAAALAMDVIVLRALVERVGWHYLPASAVAFIVGAGVAYVLSVRFVFHSRQLNSRSVEFTCFVALGMAGLLVNSAALTVAISVAGFGLIPAKLFAAVCTFATNFTLRRALLFASSSISQ